MARRHEVPSRSEIGERVDRSRDELREKEAAMDVTAKDVEFIRQTLAGLELKGTAEGMDEVEAAVARADDETVGVFDVQDQELESIQSDSEDYEDSLRERSETTESDLGKLSNACGEIETGVALSELQEAKDTALRDIDFLEQQDRAAQEARNKSEQLQDEYRSRVRHRSGA